jgi:hypothetical protein
MSTEQDFEEFAKKYPDLMAKSNQQYIGVSKGWHHILDALFSTYCRRLESAKTTLKYAMENPDQKYTRSIPELEAEVAAAQRELPTIQQIKEKFGGLRVYTSGGNAKMDACTNFAEAMASRICEVCGSPGKPRQTSWIKTLCDKHYQEIEAGMNIHDDEEDVDDDTQP